MTRAPRPVADSRLRAMGWTASLEQEMAGFRDTGCRSARVAIDFGADLAVRTASGEERAKLSPELYPGRPRRRPRRGG